MLSSRTSRQRRDRADVVEGQAVAGMHLEAEAVGERRHLGEPRQLGVAPRGVAGEVGLAVGAGVQLDHRRADPVRGLDLPAVGGDEDRDPAAGVAQRRDEVRQPVLLARHLEPALGGALLAPLGNDADRVRPVAQRDRLHLVGRGHLEVEGQRQLGDQRRDVGVGDVAPVLAQMRGDAVGAGRLGELRGAQRVGIGPAAGVPHGRDVVDVDTEPQAVGSDGHGSGLASGAPWLARGYRRRRAPRQPRISRRRAGRAPGRASGRGAGPGRPRPAAEAAGSRRAPRRARAAARRRSRARARNGRTARAGPTGSRRGRRGSSRLDQSPLAASPKASESRSKFSPLAP